MRNKTVVYKYLPILITALYWSCAPSIPPGSKFYKAEAPLTKEIAYSQSTPLKLQIPEGWFTSEDNECKCIDVWLIRNDFSATINLVTLDTSSTVDPEGNELSEMVVLSKKKRSEKLNTGFVQTKEDEYFTLDKKKYAAYEFKGDEGLPVRVIVFRYGDQYFELSAMPAYGVGKHPVNPQELFTVQQSVLNSIK